MIRSLRHSRWPVLASMGITIAAALVWAGGGFASAAPADQPLTRSMCQAMADNTKLTAAQRTWGRNCVLAFGQTASPSPSGSATPTIGPSPSDSPSASPSAVPTSQSPSPSPTATTPSPSPTAQDWPGPNNTGVPVGVQLTTYTGPCTITTPTTIDAKTINCGTLFIRAAVVITRSKVNGAILEDYVDSASISLDQVEVDAGQQHNAAVSNTHVTVKRSNIHGAAASVQCGSDCTVTDSWLHGQYAPDGSWHDDAFITNGGAHMVLTHNTIACDDQHGACSGDVFLAADFAMVSDVAVDGNLLAASPNVQYCTYGGANRLGAENVRYTGNVFQRGGNGQCGKYGPTTFLGGAGFVWSGNVWDSGEVLPAG